MDKDKKTYILSPEAGHLYRDAVRFARHQPSPTEFILEGDLQWLAVRVVGRQRTRVARALRQEVEEQQLLLPDAPPPGLEKAQRKVETLYCIKHENVIVTAGVEQVWPETPETALAYCLEKHASHESHKNPSAMIALLLCVARMDGAQLALTCRLTAVATSVASA